MDLIIMDIPKATERRLALGKLDIRCPKCNTNQVQLIDWFLEPAASWKCRECKYKFITITSEVLPSPSSSA